jgi:ribosomal protein S18 acetylase RimI-like enzyme
MATVRELFREYAAALGAAWVDSQVCLQSFESELAGLPGRYAPVLLAFESENLAGCVALRLLANGICEMKRLYVRPAFQGSGLGRALVERVIAEAQRAGYHALRLDTLPVMESAIALYRSLGFREIPPYGDNPAEAICFELQLQSQRSSPA